MSSDATMKDVSRLHIPARVRRTAHTTAIDPDGLLEFLSDLDSHGVLNPSYACEELRKCGFLADLVEDRSRIEVNGFRLAYHNPNKGRPGDWGRPGIWTLQLAMLIYQTITGEQYRRAYLGGGTEYRRIIDVLQDIFTEKLREMQTQNAERT